MTSGPVPGHPYAGDTLREIKAGQGDGHDLTTAVLLGEIHKTLKRIEIHLATITDENVADGDSEP